jgi:hypothetical protein
VYARCRGGEATAVPGPWRAQSAWRNAPRESGSTATHRGTYRAGALYGPGDTITACGLEVVAGRTTTQNFGVFQVD